MIGLPRAFETRDQQKASVMKHLDELEVPLLKAAFRRDGGLHQEKGVFSFTSGEWHWWGAIETYPLGKVQQLVISIMVPERDFLGDVRRQATYMILIFIVSLIIAIVMSFVLASRYSRPLQALANRSRRIRRLDLEASEEISSHLKEVRRLVRAHEDMTSGLESFSRYVPVELVKQLLKQGEVAKIGGVTRELSILFTDIRDFTSISEQMSPEALTDHMAGYFDLMLKELNRTNATVDKLIGDAIVAFWGAPNEDPDNIRHCVEAVINCISALKQFNDASEARRLPRFETCFGLGTGPVVVGNVGSHSRLNYTALGDTMNLTSRLEGLNRLYGTVAIAMESIVRKAGSGYLFRKLDIVAPGIAYRQPVREALQTGVIDGREAIVPVTLGDLFAALAIGVIGWIVARRVPGLLEIVLRQRMHISAGSAYAATRVFQYALTTLILVMVMNALGMSWSSIQWAVA